MNGYDECTRLYISLVGTENYLSIPFTHPACMNLPVFVEQSISVNESISSGLTGDLEEWQHVQIEKIGSSFSLKRNNNIVITTEVSQHWGKFNTLKVHFVGNGEVYTYYGEIA